jgi:monoamine oxidase
MHPLTNQPGVRLDNAQSTDYLTGEPTMKQSSMFDDAAGSPLESTDESVVAAKYGWKVISNEGKLELYNRKGNLVCIVTQTGRKYMIRDMADNKLMGGNGNLPQAIEKVLTQYYYAKPV